jgi:hypothetical protein
MEQSTIWRVGTDITVTAVAVIEAVNEALKGAPQVTGNPPVHIVSLLNYLPIALLSLLAMAWLIRLLFSPSKSSPNFVSSPLERFNGVLRWREGRLKQVAGKQFTNQEVPLDGIEYIDCVFDGVTFVYNGTGKTAISGKSIITAKPDGKPNFQLKTESPLVGSVALIFQELGLLREDARRRIESIPLDRQ